LSAGKHAALSKLDFTGNSKGDGWEGRGRNEEYRSKGNEIAKEQALVNKDKMATLFLPNTFDNAPHLLALF